MLRIGNEMADLSQMINKVFETPDYTESFAPQDIQQNKAMSILAYIGILALVPVFAARNSAYAKFHANQGLLLLIAEAAVALVFGLLGLVDDAAVGAWVYNKIQKSITPAVLQKADDTLNEWFGAEKVRGTRVRRVD
jgi:hypothetical protein